MPLHAENVPPHVLSGVVSQVQAVAPWVQDWPTGQAPWHAGNVSPQGGAKGHAQSLWHRPSQSVPVAVPSHSSVPSTTLLPHTGVGVAVGVNVAVGVGVAVGVAVACGAGQVQPV